LRILKPVTGSQKKGPKKTSIGDGRGSKFGHKLSKKRYRKRYVGQGK
jgi:hypothetical protein|tara:strand:- start:260 stop:400 length:141 start_codon:yes stop_codon:yes gene_type:complete